MHGPYPVWDALTAPVNDFIARRLREIQAPTPCADGGGDWPRRLRLAQYSELCGSLDQLRPRLGRSGYPGPEIEARLEQLRAACWALAQCDDGPPDSARVRWERGAGPVYRALEALRPVAVAAAAEPPKKEPPVSRRLVEAARAAWKRVPSHTRRKVGAAAVLREMSLVDGTRPQKLAAVRQLEREDNVSIRQKVKK